MMQRHMNHCTEKMLPDFDIQTVPALGTPWFTGWRHVQPNDPSSGVVGQIVYILPNDERRRFIYVNLPGLETGTAFEGEVMDIGTKRMREDSDIEEMRNIMRAGLDKLHEEIEEFSKS